LSNAIKFSKDREVVIRLSTRPEEKQFVLEIIDTGDGIPSDSLGNLFKPFVKNDKSVPGAGLGLHISRQLVERMFGSLDLDSQVGRGTTFRVLLPWGQHEPISQTGLVKRVIVTPAGLGESRLPTISTATSEANPSKWTGHVTNPSPAPEMSTSSSPNSTGAQQSAIDQATSLNSPSITHRQKRPLETLPTKLSQSLQCGQRDTRTAWNLAIESRQSAMTVLIVDDNEICRKLLRAGLKRSPIRNIVLEAADGQEAVRVYKDKRPNLVITDISMPGMDGVTAAGLMRDADIISTKTSPSTGEYDTRSSRRDPGYTSPARIYALTGLGSSDPRLTATALTGFAGLDGWLIKGKANMEAINNIMTEMDREQNGLSTMVA
jgi:CheY-like chemotaxis protein